MIEVDELEKNKWREASVMLRRLDRRGRGRQRMNVSPQQNGQDQKGVRRNTCAWCAPRAGTIGFGAGAARHALVPLGAGGAGHSAGRAGGVSQHHVRGEPSCGD